MANIIIRPERAMASGAYDNDQIQVNGRRFEYVDDAIRFFSRRARIQFLAAILTGCPFVIDRFSKYHIPDVPHKEIITGLLFIVSVILITKGFINNTNVTQINKKWNDLESFNEDS